MDSNGLTKWHRLSTRVRARNGWGLGLVPINATRAYRVPLRSFNGYPCPLSMGCCWFVSFWFKSCHIWCPTFLDCHIWHPTFYELASRFFIYWRVGFLSTHQEVRETPNNWVYPLDILDSPIPIPLKSYFFFQDSGHCMALLPK